MDRYFPVALGEQKICALASKTTSTLQAEHPLPTTSNSCEKALHLPSGPAFLCSMDQLLGRNGERVLAVRFASCLLTVSNQLPKAYSCQSAQATDHPHVNNARK